MQTKIVHKGVYIVVDPAMEQEALITQLKKIKNQPIAALQIWDNPAAEITGDLIKAIVALFKDTNTPVLINNQWQYLKQYDLDGIHFDVIPANLEQLSQEIGREFIKGITLTNDLDSLSEIEDLKFNYLSFCSIFPSSTSNSCDLVDLKTIETCREKSKLPIFLSGGIKPENIHQLEHLNYDGVAIVSGIMKASNPEEALKNYTNELNPYQ